MAHFFSFFLSFRGIAQLVEQRSPKPRVVSSILTAPAKYREKPRKQAVCVAFTFYPLYIKADLKMA